MYVKGDYIYSANYEAGSRIYKIKSDYSSLEEVAYFDISTVCNGFEGFYIFKPTL
jgi:hypothetical protein